MHVRRQYRWYGKHSEFEWRSVLMLECELTKRWLKRRICHKYVGTVFLRASSVSECGLTLQLKGCKRCDGTTRTPVIFYKYKTKPLDLLSLYLEHVGDSACFKILTVSRYFSSAAIMMISLCSPVALMRWHLLLNNGCACIKNGVRLSVRIGEAPNFSLEESLKNKGFIKTSVAFDNTH